MDRGERGYGDKVGGIGGGGVESGVVGAQSGLEGAGTGVEGAGVEGAGSLERLGQEIDYFN